MTIDELKVVIKAETSQLKKDVAEVKKQLKETGDTAKEAGKKTSNLGKEFNQFMGKIAAAKILFDLIMKAIQAIIKSIKDGIKNLSKFDGTFKKDWDTLLASVAQLKDAFGAAFAPLIKVVTPVITKLVQLTTQLTQNLSKMFAGVTGSPWIKAAGDVDEYKKSIDNAKKSTLGIDEINTISSGEDDNSHFESVALDNTVEGFGSTLMDSVSGILDPIFELLNGLIDPIRELLVAIMPIIQMVTDFASRILSPIVNLVKELVQKLMPAITSILSTAQKILEPILNLVVEIVNAVIENIPPELFETISDCIKELMYLLETLLAPVLDLIDILAPIISNILGNAIKMIASGLQTALKILQPFITILEAIGTVCNGIWDTFKAIFSMDFASIGDIWKGVGDKLKGTWDKLVGQLKDAWNSFCDHFKNIFKTAVNGIIGFANIWIDGLNAVLLPIRAIVLGVAKAFGKDVSLSDIAIPHIPKLAKGGIIDSPTIAMLGEYSNARNNPEIAAPESTLRDIMTEGNGDLIATFIQVGRQLMATIEDKNLSVTIGDDVIAASAARGNRSYFNRTGTNLITV